MKKILTLVLVLVVLASGCLVESGNDESDEQVNCTWTLPHAKIIHVTRMDYSDMPLVELADFSTFQELANGTVYAVDVYDLFTRTGLRLVYIGKDMVYSYYIDARNCTADDFVIENNTIKAVRR